MRHRVVLAIVSFYFILIEVNTLEEIFGTSPSKDKDFQGYSIQDVRYPGQAVQGYPGYPEQSYLGYPGQGYSTFTGQGYPGNECSDYTKNFQQSESSCSTRNQFNQEENELSKMDLNLEYCSDKIDVEYEYPKQGQECPVQGQVYAEQGKGNSEQGQIYPSQEKGYTIQGQLNSGQFYLGYTGDHQQSRASTSSKAQSNQKNDEFINQFLKYNDDGTDDQLEEEKVNLPHYIDADLSRHKLSYTTPIKKKCADCSKRQRDLVDRGFFYSLEKVDTKCKKCRKHYCLECFNRIHNQQVLPTKEPVDYDHCPHCKEYVGESFETVILHTKTCEKVFRPEGPDGKPYKYACIFCTRLTPDKAAIEKHIPSHTKHHPHLCTICGKKYTIKSSLNRHIMKKHHKLS